SRWSATVTRRSSPSTTIPIDICTSLIRIAGTSTGSTGIIGIRGMHPTAAGTTPGITAAGTIPGTTTAFIWASRSAGVGVDGGVTTTGRTTDGIIRAMHGRTRPTMEDGGTI